jgi:hypothetical protein
MVQEAYPGSDMEGGRAMREYLHGKKAEPKPFITDEDKKAIYTAYMKWANQLFDDLEDKSSITADELVYKVLELVEEKLA